MNINELILDRARSLRLTKLDDGSILTRVTKLEDPSLQVSAESEDVVDAMGSLITRLFRAKTGRFSATNSLFSTDMYALQLGAEKEIANDNNKVNKPIEQIIPIKDGKVTLAHTPSNVIKYIYKFERNNVATKYTVAEAVSETEFMINGKEITVPTGVEGKIYVEYEYESTQAVRIRNNSEKFPEAVGVKIDVIFRDQCNENIKYAGTIVAEKGKIDPSQLELALTSTGKHAIDIDFFKDYCDEDADLFTIIIAGDEDEE